MGARIRRNERTLAAAWSDIDVPESVAVPEEVVGQLLRGMWWRRLVADAGPHSVIQTALDRDSVLAASRPVRDEFFVLRSQLRKLSECTELKDPALDVVTASVIANFVPTILRDPEVWKYSTALGADGSPGYIHFAAMLQGEAKGQESSPDPMVPAHQIFGEASQVTFTKRLCAAIASNSAPLGCASEEQHAALVALAQTLTPDDLAFLVPSKLSTAVVPLGDGDLIGLTGEQRQLYLYAIVDPSRALAQTLAKDPEVAAAYVQSPAYLAGVDGEPFDPAGYALIAKETSKLKALGFPKIEVDSPSGLYAPVAELSRQSPGVAV